LVDRRAERTPILVGHPGLGEVDRAADRPGACEKVDIRRDVHGSPATDGSVADGPVPETKAVIGGFSIIEVTSRDEALAWAAKIAESCRCAQEVREIGYDPES